MSVLLKKVEKGNPRKTTKLKMLKSSASKGFKKGVQKIKVKVVPNHQDFHQDLKNSAKVQL